MSMAPVSQELGPCPLCCATDPETGRGEPCGAISSKLSKASGGNCVVGCVGPSCRNRRNQKKGKRGEYNRHKRFAGAGWTPHDEIPYLYSLEFTTQDKKGAVVPANFQRFVQGEWARHAWAQVEKKIPEGVSAFAALYLEPPGSEWYLLVRGKKGGR